MQQPSLLHDQPHVRVHQHRTAVAARAPATETHAALARELREQAGALLAAVREIESVERLADQLRARKTGALLERGVRVDDVAGFRIGDDDLVEIALEREQILFRADAR